jgi:metallophosphoesterase superfamily enzyme
VKTKPIQAPASEEKDRASALLNAGIASLRAGRVISAGDIKRKVEDTLANRKTTPPLLV